MTEIKAIETVYNGIHFRSRAEARWAVFFDALRIKYFYEPEGLIFSDGTCYLPDFFLPETNTFFEVKGVMDGKSAKKIGLLLEQSDKHVVVGYPDMSFEASDDWEKNFPHSLSSKSESVLALCNVCGKPYFMGMLGSFRCRSCGNYCGDQGFEIVAEADKMSQDYLQGDIRDAYLLAIGKRFEFEERR